MRFISLRSIQFAFGSEQLDKEHPEAARLVAGYGMINLLAELGKYYQEKKDNKKAAEYYFKVINTKFGYSNNEYGYNGRAFNGYDDAYMFYFRNPKYVTAITLDQWKQAAKVNDISTVSLLEMISGAKPFALATLSDYHGREWLYNQTLGLDKMEFPKLLRKLAEEGDPEAMNAMAVRYAPGKEGKKSDAISMFKKAAAAGSLWANLNLVFASDWGLKNYGTENKTAAKQNLRKYLENAPPLNVQKY